MRSVITLCESTKFKEAFLEVARKLILEGRIVLTSCVFGHADGVVMSKDEKIKLDKLHLRKIDMPEEIYVANVNVYIGESTQSKIDYARSQGKSLTYRMQNPEGR